MRSQRVEAASETLIETIRFRGHPMVRSTHPTTLEVTTESHLTEKGDCIIGVSADKGCAGLGAGVKDLLRSEDSRVRLVIRVGPEEFTLSARGDPGLTLKHPHDIVVRRSGFLSDRTLAVGAGASAADLPRGMVDLLQDPSSEGTLVIEVSRG